MGQSNKQDGLLFAIIVIIAGPLQGEDTEEVVLILLLRKYLVYSATNKTMMTYVYQYLCFINCHQCKISGYEYSTLLVHILSKHQQLLTSSEH